MRSIDCGTLLRALFFLGLAATASAAPGPFSKLSPANGSLVFSTTVQVDWEPAKSSIPVHYEVCLETSAGVCGEWVDMGTATTAYANHLSGGVTYYWQVRAVSDSGTTYANEADWWSMTASTPAPFAKTAPSHGTVFYGTPTDLSWEASQGVDHYQTCFQTSSSGTCVTGWMDRGLDTSVDISDLEPGTYYWQVRAVNVFGPRYADGGAWWVFRVSRPGSFGKTAPANLSTPSSTTVEVSWDASAGADHYEYCVDQTNDDACDAAWVAAGTATSRTLSLMGDRTYYWQVRAVNVHGETTADFATWWSFTLARPAAFAKLSPANGATRQATSPTLSWEASAGATYYQYCIDTSNDAACSTAWTNAAANTSATPSLATATTYYWQVRAVNGIGTAVASGGWWSFTTLSPPQPFSKSAPANGAAAQSISPTLTWDASTGAASYEYCIDTTSDNACSSTWASSGLATSVTLGGLAGNTTHYWQVRAVNADGTTYSGGGWWSLTTVSPPGAFAKSAPVDGATGQALTVTLSWSASVGASSYEYCLDTTRDAACGSLWMNTSGRTSINQGGLAAGTTYSWQVRAINASGALQADGGDWWSFTTVTRVIGLTGDLGFGDVAVGETATRPLTINNGGSGTLTVTGIVYPPGFTGAWSGTIPTGGEHVVTVTFTPTEAVPYGGTITVNGNHTSGTNTIGVTGTGVETTGVVRFDFTGDRKSDVLWRHATQGDVWLWPMNGAARAAETYVRTVADTNWEIRGLGDQTGDGKADILWRHATTGQIYFWPMDGGSPQSETYVTTVPTEYDIVGTGDFNGDGKSDILWRHLTSGEVWVWLMDGSTRLSEVRVDTVDPAYVVKGVGDVDGDGKTDIVWHHATAGEVWVWRMDGTSRLSATWVATVADVGYQIVGVADHTGDGKSDLLWHHATRGEVWLWAMDGTTRLAETWVAAVPDTNYRIVGDGDYDGDGKADILWHHATAGEVWVWLMDGAVPLSQTWVGTVADVGYQIVKVK